MTPARPVAAELGNIGETGGSRYDALGHVQWFRQLPISKIRFSINFVKSLMWARVNPILASCVSLPSMDL